ncbi:hypothetical protein D0T84_20135 [Dysgonomonas sp. 521]|uniref:hypothetical protein n=1 Tax=Dysgonomonas sp. 521 TaxID=2302932 RepID=UPI0013D89F1E|nr:hypothetical protein [Dysgonomonas sp. 521]NDV97193.1 hypothetical protein [Dysgonomonas sp. 521]
MAQKSIIPTTQQKEKLKELLEKKIEDSREPDFDYSIEIESEADCRIIIEGLQDFCSSEEDKRRVPEPITFKRLLNTKYERGFNKNFLNLLCRYLGYKGWNHFSGIPEDLIHPDKFDNRNILRGTKFSIGIEDVYAVLECVSDYFEYKVIRGQNIRRNSDSESFLTPGFTLVCKKDEQPYIKLKDVDGGYFKQHDIDDNDVYCYL